MPSRPTLLSQKRSTDGGWPSCACAATAKRATAFADGAARFPDQPLFKLALARMLAAAPDDQLRDGRRAMADCR